MGLGKFLQLGNVFVDNIDGQALLVLIRDAEPSKDGLQDRRMRKFKAIGWDLGPIQGFLG